MNWWEALLIGFIQGISEFLPISSTAHLLIAKRLLGIEVGHSELGFEVFLHVASLLAVLVYFRHDLIKILQDFFSYIRTKHPKSRANFRFGMLILFSTLVTMITGKAVENLLGEGITTVALIGASLIITGLFLVLIEHGTNNGTRQAAQMTWKDGLIIGLGQALAVIPGISRSGSTLIAALWCGLTKETALRYSFLLSIPIIMGISMLKMPEMIASYDISLFFPLIIAFISSFFFALIGIKWLISMVQNTQLTYFACYCIALGLVTWIFL